MRDFKLCQLNTELDSDLQQRDKPCRGVIWRGGERLATRSTVRMIISENARCTPSKRLPANDTNYPLNLLCKLCAAIVKADPDSVPHPQSRPPKPSSPVPPPALAASAVAASRVCGEAIQTIAGIIIMLERQAAGGPEETYWDKADS